MKKVLSWTPELLYLLLSLLFATWFKWFTLNQKESVVMSTSKSLFLILYAPALLCVISIFVGSVSASDWSAWYRESIFHIYFLLHETDLGMPPTCRKQYWQEITNIRILEPIFYCLRSSAIIYRMKHRNFSRFSSNLGLCNFSKS